MATCFQSLKEGLLSQATLAGTCNVSDIATAPSNQYTAQVYDHQKLLIPFFHAAPRFGRSNDVDNYVTGNAGAQDDYKKGLRMMAIIFWVILFLWYVLLLCMYWSDLVIGGFLNLVQYWRKVFLPVVPPSEEKGVAVRCDAKKTKPSSTA